MRGVMLRGPEAHGGHHVALGTARTRRTSPQGPRGDRDVTGCCCRALGPAGTGEPVLCYPEALWTVGMRGTVPRLGDSGGASQTATGSWMWFCRFTTKSFCPETVTRRECSPNTTAGTG